MGDWITRRDNEPFDIDGMRGRIMAPKAPGRVQTRDLPGRKLYLFTLQAGDTCQEDRDRYGERNELEKIPQRAFFAAEGASRQPAIPGPFFAEFDLMILGGAPVTAWWTTLFQWNTLPMPGEVGKSPPVAIGHKVIGGLDCLTFDTHTVAEAGTKVNAPGKTVGTVPFSRDQARRVRVEAKDGMGGEGFFRVQIGGVQVLDYVGPIGFPRHMRFFPAWGYYRCNNAKEPITVRFENFREGLLTP